MNIKKIALLILGVVVIGVVIFFATKQDTKAPIANPVSTSATGLVVAIENYQFNPSALTVKKGDTVVWTNNDSAPHIVAGDKSPWVPGGSLKKGDTYTHTFDTVGSFSYYCFIHPSMRGTVTVTE
jgi:plastocyanin